MELWLIGYIFTLGGVITSGALEKEKWYVAVGSIILLLVIWPAVLGTFVYLVYDKLFPEE